MFDYDPTPTEELILDTLVARARLGENVWPFSTKFQRQCERLQQEGLVTVAHGNVEKTVRVALTAHGRREYLETVHYQSPLEKRLGDTIQHVLGIIDPKNFPVGDDLREAQGLLRGLVKP